MREQGESKIDVARKLVAKNPTATTKDLKQIFAKLGINSTQSSMDTMMAKAKRQAKGETKPKPTSQTKAPKQEAAEDTELDKLRRKNRMLVDLLMRMLMEEK